MNMAIVEAYAEIVAKRVPSSVILIFSVFLSFLVWQYIYNVYIHPLAHIPGPRLWASTQILSIYKLVSGQLVKSQQKLHDKYGDVVRLGPNEVSFASEQACDDIYKLRPGHKLPIKDPVFYHAPNGMPENIVTTKSSDEHARLRKILRNSFSEDAMAAQAPIVEKYANTLIARLTERITSCGRPGAVLNCTDWVNFFTVDVIGDLALGESFKCLETGDLQVWAQNLFNFFVGMVLAAAARCFMSAETLIEWVIPRRILQLQRNHTNFTKDRLERRLNMETSRPDFMTPVLRSQEKSKPLSREEIESNFALLLVAGSETTATVTAGILNALSKDVRVLKKLEAVVRSCFSSNEEITVESSKKISYLDATIHEGLRMCNPVPGGLPRIVPEGGDVYAGVFLPAGTRISTRPRTIVRSEQYFARPDEFIPERWLDPSKRPVEFLRDCQSSSRAFSAGPSSCLGQPLAWAEMRLLLAKLIWSFDISAEPGYDVDWDALMTIIFVQKRPINLRVRMSASAMAQVAETEA